MKRYLLGLAVALAILLTGMMNSAYAILTISITQGATTFIVADGSALDMSGAAGVVTFIGNVGSFSVNVSTGISKPVVGSPTFPQLDLNSVDVSSGAGGTLVLKVTDTDFVSTPFPGFYTELGGVSDGTIEVISGLDNLNTLFLTPTSTSLIPASMAGMIFGPGAFSTTFTSDPVFPQTHFP